LGALTYEITDKRYRPAMGSLMEHENINTFQSLVNNIGRFNVRDKTVLFPEMNRIGCHLLAATFRGFGIDALVMETHKGIDLGLEYSSGKECYPCQVTLGDILYFMGEEIEKLGDDFNPDNYIYFMPEAEGPCRFGMYNKYQRIVLDSFPQLGNLKINALTSVDSYSLKGIVDEDSVGDLKKSGYFSVVVGDIMDRLLWRIRPYEREPGIADEFIEKAMRNMEDAFEAYGAKKNFKEILNRLEETINEGKLIIDPDIPLKPLIGIVGEIYLRSHVHSNQDLIRVMERHGAEVVNASIAEWVNYTSYIRVREAKSKLRLNIKQFRLNNIIRYLKNIVRFSAELFYQELRQKQVYRRAQALIDLAGDHKIAHLEEILKEDNLFSFDIGTEACLSISGILQYVREGFNGVVNVYPFTCMPSTVTSAVIGPVMNSLGVPYLDIPYDSSIQPSREAAIRTFMYQAHQHMERNGRKGHNGIRKLNTRKEIGEL
jgi:predicted nucleotide-binding protein (sugar kinase/HSP70/actin superfamily)